MRSCFGTTCAPIFRAAGAYGQVKRALAQVAPDYWDTYYAVKDPACDLVIAAAEQRAIRVGWTPAESDASPSIGRAR